VRAAGRPDGPLRFERAVIEALIRDSRLGDHNSVSQQLVSLVARALAAERSEPLTRHVISKEWHKQTLERAGLRNSVRPHDLRHTAATYWLIQGEPLYFVQKQLGHRDSKTTEHGRQLPGRAPRPPRRCPVAASAQPPGGARLSVGMPAPAFAVTPVSTGCMGRDLAAAGAQLVLTGLLRRGVTNCRLAWYGE
jgi:Phage integrase family